MHVVEARKKKLGEDHPNTLISIEGLAFIFWNQRRRHEAEKLQVHVIESRKTKLGEDHPDTLTSMSNLALTFWSQGRWDEAEKLEMQVMAVRKNKLGKDHADTLASMAQLAFIRNSSGQRAGALNSFTSGFLGRRQILGVFTLGLCLVLKFYWFGNTVAEC
jgi:hypothetical protein